MIKKKSRRKKSDNRIDTELPIRQKQKVAPQREIYLSPDGKPRAEEREHEINECFAICFRGRTGEIVKDYLRSITVNRVQPSSATPTQLAYAEGSRWVMGIIETRIRHGEAKLP